MTLLYKNIFKWTLMLGLMMSALFANAATYIVDRAGGNIANGTANTGSFAYVLDKVRGTVGPHTINFTYTGTIVHDADLNAWTDPWNLTVNANNTATINDLVTINGNGATISWAGYNSPGQTYGVHTLTITGSFITINNLKFTGGSSGVAPYTEKGAGVCISEGDATNGLNAFHDITLNGCSFLNNGGTGIFNTTSTSPATAWSPLSTGNSKGVKNITLSNCIATGNNLSGIQFSQADNVKIINTNSNLNGQHGIYFCGINYVKINATGSAESTSPIGVTNSLIDGCQANNNGTSTKGGGIVLKDKSNFNIIQGCTTNTNYEHGIWLQIDNDNNQILNNITNDNGLVGAFMGCGINISLSNNTNNLIKGNFTSGNDYGIYLYDNYGLAGNDLNFIENNTIVKNLSDGVRVINSNRTVIRNNFVGTNNLYAPGLGNGRDGIYYANSSTGGEISGNVVINNAENGIDITAGKAEPKTPFTAEVDIPKGGSNNNYIFNNYVGIDKNGVVNPNIKDGVVLSESFGNNVGKSGPAPLLAHANSPVVGIVANTRYRNYISGNGQNGISLNNIDPNSPGNILNPKGETLLATVIEGNFIGTNLTGTSAIANKFDGIGTLNSATSKVSRISILDNLISGNDGDGIQLGGSNSVTAATDLISIQGNTIGLNLALTAALPNGGHGLNLVSTQNVAIGDPSATGFTAKSNLISGNTLDGIEITSNASDINVYYNRIGTNPTGTSAFPNRIGIWMDGANKNDVVGNLISGNKEDGIYIVNASGSVNPNTIAKNYIGTNQTGLAALPNGFNGITLDKCNNNKIGTSTSDGNLISGNDGHGIELKNNSDANFIDGNVIGLNGTKSLLGVFEPSGKIANKKNGILLSTGSLNNKIGTVVANYISGNDKNGIELIGASKNTIAKNFIGLGFSDSPFGNKEHGILLNGSTDNTIGGATAADGNTIAGNNSIAGLFNGISLTAASNINTISNNKIGTLISGQGNPTSDGIQTIGVSINASNTNTLNANIIGNASSHGVSLVSASSNIFTGNLIGMDISGNNKIPNGGDGLNLLSSNDNKIGGPLSTDGNTISGNSLNGVSIAGTGTGVNATTGNLLQNNSIGLNKLGTAAWGNTLIGVELTNANTTQILSNVVSANKKGGILLTNSGSVGNANIINANTVGFGLNGTAAFANTGGEGISLVNSKGNTIGASGLANIIGNHNTFNGISLSAASDNNAINYNTIGLNKNLSAVAKNLNGILVKNSTITTITFNTIAGNGNDGIKLDAATSANINNNTIGTNATNATTLGNGGNGINVTNGSNAANISTNIIGNSGVDGLAIDESNNAVVSANLIGTIAQASTINLGNVGNGISLKNGSTGATIGKTNNIAYNKIAVFVDGATTTGNTITENSIYCNTETSVPGIQLSTLGNNNFLNPFIYNQPVGLVVNKGATGPSLVMGGIDLALAPVGSVIEIFKKDAVCDDCKQGKTFVGRTTVIATSPIVGDTKGGFIYNFPNGTTLTDPLNCKDYIITITNTTTRNTSQFSNCSDCISLCVPSTVKTSPASKTVCEKTDVTFTAELSNQNANDILKWQMFDTGTNTYVDLVENATYVGTDKLTLTIKNVDSTMTNTRYRLKINTCSDDIFTNVSPVPEAFLTVNTIPRVTLDPLPIRICENGSNTFTAFGSGKNLTFEWQVATKTNPTTFNPIAGATTASYTYSNIPQSADGNIYRVLIKGDCPTTPLVYTDTAQLFVDSTTTIKTHPVDVAICSPGDAKFKVDVLGRTGATYQWQESVNGGTFAPITNAGIYSDAATTSLTLTGATNALVDAKYKLVVTGKCTNATSNEANLKFTVAPTVNTQPQSTPVCEDLNTTLTATINNATSYYWEVSTDNAVTWNKVVATSVYSDVTTNTLKFTKVPLSFNTYRYRLVGEGACTPIATTQQTILTVYSKPTAPVLTALTPICEGANVSIPATATGTGVLTGTIPNQTPGDLQFKWKVSVNNGAFNDLATVTSPYTYATSNVTATSSTLDITNADTTLNQVKYRVEVTGACGIPVNSNDILLTVNSKPKLTSPADISICENATNTLSISTTGTGVSAQWQIDLNQGAGFVDIVADNVFKNVATNTLQIVDPSPTLNGAKFQVVAKGTCNNTTGVTSAKFAVLTVNTIPVISLEPKNKVVCEGTSTGFGVKATGTGLKYQWQLNTGAGFVDIPGQTNDTLLLSNVTSTMDNYKYQVVIKGTCKTETSKVANLTVNRSPQLLLYPQSATICPGNTVKFTSNALAVANLNYRWLRDTGTGIFDTIPGANQKDYTTPIVSVATGGFKYQLVVWAACPNPIITTPVGITLTTAPVITVDPSDANICEGGDANFTVVATNATSYVWSIDGVGNLSDDATFSGTTTSSLDIAAATFAQFNGQVFRVTAFGACGPNPSSTATIKFVIPTVDPILPTIVCDSTLTNIELKSTGPGSSGLGTTYVWSSIALSPGVVPNPSVDVARGKDGKHVISELLDNKKATPVDVQYTVTPYKAGCYGSPEIALVTVRPTVYLALDGPFTDKCIGADQTLTATFFPNGKYAWVVNQLLLDKDTSNIVTVKVPSEVAEVEVFFLDTLYKCNHPSVIDSIIPIPLTKVDYVRTRLCAGFEVAFTPNVPTNALVDNFVWTFGDFNVTKNSTILSPEIGYNYKNAGSFLTIVDAFYKGCKVATYDSTLIVSDCSLQFRNTITPNGDNQNEEFEIGNIDLYPNAEISIFNRWGVIIWSGKNLTVNKFRGLNTSGEVLEDGVYYYVLDLKTGSNKQSIKKGYITLMKTTP